MARLVAMKNLIWNTRSTTNRKQNTAPKDPSHLPSVRMLPEETNACDHCGRLLTLQQTYDCNV